jgi:hydroxymethylbilane synthase
MCPAAGQGALAIETRDDGGAGQEIARKLDHAATNAAVTAERSLLATLEGGCQVPIGAHGRYEGSTLHLIAMVASPDGTRVMRDEVSGTGDPAALGRELGKRMLAAGARHILGS